MRRFLPFILVCLVFLPLSFTLGHLGSKPMDIVPSDFLILLSPLAVFQLARLRLSGLAKKFTLALGVYLTYCVLDLLVAQLDGRGGLVSFASFVRAVRPFFIFYTGFMLFHWSNGRVERWSCKAAAFLPFLLLFSDIIFNRHFPNPRWGGYFFAEEVYGFPNSPGFFYVIVFCLLLYGAIYSGVQRIILAGAAIVMAMIVVFVGSRNALISFSLAVGMLLYLKHLDRRLIWLFLPMIALGIYTIMVSDIDMGLFAHKAQRSMDDGVLYGRLGVWEEVMQVVSNKIVFGYGFEPLTQNYDAHGTAHNQYIEYLYKTGFVGLILVGFIWYYVGRAYLLASRSMLGGVERKFYSFLLVAFLACMASNFAQPNLSYSITQSLFVFFGGVAAARLSQQNIKDYKRRRNEAGSARLELG